MTIDFKEKEITSFEEEGRYPVIGYFSPSGNLIPYNNALGGSYHGAWQNPVSWTFLSYVSYIIMGTSIDDLLDCPNLYKKCIYPGINEFVKRGYGGDSYFNSIDFETFLSQLDERITRIEKNWKSYGKIDDYDRFEYDLLLFFRNAYKNKSFFEAIQKKIQIEDPDDIEEKLLSLPIYKNVDRRFASHAARDVVKKELLSYLKDICVQYLGYDSLERFTPSGANIEIPGKNQEYQFNFKENPRVITSSYLNTNERYYNYLLMDWDVHKIPRYYFNENTGIYEESPISMFYQSDKEDKLEKEIAAIKKLVPRNERKKYFK